MAVNVAMTYVSGYSPFGLMYFFTYWGLFVTLWAFIVGTILAFIPKPTARMLNKNSPFQLWKFWIVLYEIAFVFEFNITFVYWSFLWIHLNELRDEASSPYWTFNLLR